MIGLDWPSSEIVWNVYNPHPKLSDLQSTPEIVFIGKGSGAADAFNSEQSASAGLQEMVTLFPGLLRPKSGGSGPEFIPLLRTGPSGGTIPWGDVVQQSFMGISGINPRRRHIPTHTSYTVAARLIGQIPADKPVDADKKDADKKDSEKKKDEPAASTAGKINVIAIADLDFIGEQFFGMRRRKIEGLEFDNVPFVLNCVDVLAGDESFVGLRKKRPVHRRLEVLEAQSKTFNDQLQEETRKAENEAAEELEAAQRAFDKEVDQVRNRTDLDERTKETQLIEPPAGRSAQARCQETERRGPEAEQDPREQDGIRAKEARDRKLGANRCRRDTPPAPIDPGHHRLVLTPASRKRGREPEAAGVNPVLEGAAFP